MKYYTVQYKDERVWKDVCTVDNEHKAHQIATDWKAQSRYKVRILKNEQTIIWESN